MNALSKKSMLKARTTLAEALQLLDESVPSMHDFLNSIYQMKGNYDEAITKYTTALSLEPDDTYCLAMRGEIFLRMGFFNEAASDLQRAIDSDPLQRHPAAN